MLFFILSHSKIKKSYEHGIPSLRLYIFEYHTALGGKWRFLDVPNLLLYAGCCNTARFTDRPASPAEKHQTFRVLLVYVLKNLRSFIKIFLYFLM